MHQESNPFHFPEVPDTPLEVRIGRNDDVLAQFCLKFVQRQFQYQLENDITACAIRHIIFLRNHLGSDSNYLDKGCYYLSCLNILQTIYVVPLDHSER